MQQSGASVFHRVVHWHKLGKVENECTLQNSIILAILGPKIIKVGGHLTKLWQKLFWLFFSEMRWITKSYVANKYTFQSGIQT